MNTSNKFVREAPFSFSREYKWLIVIFLVTCLFWYWAAGTTNIPSVPKYGREIPALRQMNWLNMWTWLDYGNISDHPIYSPFSPTALNWIILTDKHVLAPLLGIEFDTPSFATAARFFPLFVGLIAICSCIIYMLARALTFNQYAAMAAAFFWGLNKSHSHDFRFTGTVMIFFLIIYSCSALIFWIKYLRERRRKYLVGYYVFYLLLIGSFEHWINFFLTLLFLSIVQQIVRHRFDKGVFKHAILIPTLFFVVYMAFRLPVAMQETNSTANEDQFVFSYPSMDLMIEDMVVNASLHTADVISSLVLPFPMLSRAVIHRYDMDLLNPYNKLSFPAISKIHYLTLTDWYGGLFLGVFLVISIHLVKLAVQKVEHFTPVILGIFLFYFGFAVHVPIMYRIYFTIPDTVGVLGYKHALSILGFSILVGWGLDQIMKKYSHPLINRTAPILFFIWLAFCNYSTILVSYQAMLTPGMIP